MDKAAPESMQKKDPKKQNEDFKKVQQEIKMKQLILLEKMQ